MSRVEGKSARQRYGDVRRPATCVWHIAPVCLCLLRTCRSWAGRFPNRVDMWDFIVAFFLFPPLSTHCFIKVQRPCWNSTTQKKKKKEKKGSDLFCSAFAAVQLLHYTSPRGTVEWFSLFTERTEHVKILQNGSHDESNNNQMLQ